jgi:hypothetical protein
MYLTEQSNRLNIAERERPAQEGDPLVLQIADEVAKWEISEEFSTAFAKRIIEMVRLYDA